MPIDHLIPAAYQGLQPAEVWRHFAALNAIPRPSGQEDAVCAHVRAVAQSVAARWQNDARGNICVEIDGRGGAMGRAEGAAPVLLQSHLDMVCQKRPDVVFDFERDAIVPRRVGDQIFASGTTLGADNGLGAAMMLAVLTSPDLRHGPLELLFTVEEETGLFGAAHLDPELVRGRTLINLDSEDPEEITIGCAGGASVSLFLETARENARETFLRRHLKVGGLAGGHSGVQIHEPLGNALKILAQILAELQKSAPDLRLVDFDGGTAHNAIPRDAHATIAIPATQNGDFDCAWTEIATQIEAKWRQHEPGLHLSNEPLFDLTTTPLTQSQSAQIIALLNDLPHGVQTLSARFEGKVQTSSNLAEAHCNGEGIEICVSNRSFLEFDLAELQNRVCAAGEAIGATAKRRDGYPGWEPRAVSPLREKTIEVYREVFGTEPKVEVVHAGLECGLLSEKIPDLDAVSFGPLIRGAHTPEEWVSISSVEKSFALLTQLLSELAP